MRKIILFSPSGYIGGFIKSRIQQEKNMQLTEIVRDSDLNQYKGEYDVVIYSASTSQASAAKLVQDNVMTVVIMVNFCREHHIKRIIYLSSDSVYGEINTDVVSEKAVMVSPGVYGTTKYLAEKIIAESGIQCYILRMPGVVGRVWRNNFIYNLMSHIKENRQVELYNMDREFNNILDVDDLIDFIILLCNYDSRNTNEIFLLGNMERVKLKNLVYYIKELHHSSSLIHASDVSDKRCFTLDVTKAVEYGYSSKKVKTILDELYRIQEGRT